MDKNSHAQEQEPMFLVNVVQKSRVMTDKEELFDYEEIETEYLVTKETAEKLRAELRKTGLSEDKFGDESTFFLYENINGSKRINIWPETPAPFSDLHRIVEQAKTEGFIKKIKKDPKSLAEIAEEDQTEEICLAAVKQDGMAIRYAKHKTPKVIVEAVRQNRQAFDYVETNLLTDDVLTALFEQDPTLFVKFNRQPYALCLKAVSIDPAHLNEIRDKGTREQVREALKNMVTDTLQVMRDILTQEGIATTVICPSEELSSHYLKTEKEPILIIADDPTAQKIVVDETSAKNTYAIKPIQLHYDREFTYGEYSQKLVETQFRYYATRVAKASKIAELGFPIGDWLGYRSHTVLIDMLECLESAGFIWEAEKTKQEVDFDRTESWPITIKTTIADKDNRTQIDGPEIIGKMYRNGLYEADTIYIAVTKPQMKDYRFVDDYVNSSAFTDFRNDMRNIRTALVKQAQNQLPGRGSIKGTNKIDTSRRLQRTAPGNNAPGISFSKDAVMPGPADNR